MADVTLDLQNANAKELFGQGVRAYVLQDYDTAVLAFSKTSELLSSEHGSDTHDSLGDVYLYYGKALLELFRKESGPLGDGVLKNVDGESEPESDVASDTEVNESEKATDGPTSSETNDSDSKEVPIAESAATKESPMVQSKDGNKDDEAVEEKSSEQGEIADGANNQEEDLTDLQVAWEVLELAKSIFVKRGTDGQKKLAETLIVLGEISLESGNFSPAVDDITAGLEIQKTVFGDDSRTIAETYYKLGGALSIKGEIAEAIDCFSKSISHLKNKLDNLQKDKEHLKANTGEIDELISLIPEIEEKISDMKNLKTEIVKKSAALVEKSESSSSNPTSATSSKPVTNISHLVKRKRKDDDSQDETAAKKPSLELPNE